LHRVCEVGSYPANVWGLYEVHGNVWELTSDAWQGPLDAENTAAGDVGRWIVTKGGSWFEGVRDARFAARRPRMRGEMDTNLGLRVVREING
jgi:formylglycine-generating enzyme required for sulfatase activity